MRRPLYTSLLLLCVFVAPRQARAFSDYELFGLPPLEGGGGGGRYFTASPVDGYGCGVCHRGGIEPIVQLRGLPESEYVPGTTYDVELTWFFPQAWHSLNLEIVNASGQAAGTISLSDNLEAADRCSEPANEPAAKLVDDAAPRRVLWMNACGSSRLRFRFLAPADLELTFAASVVRSDKSEKPEGDGALEIRRVLRRQGFAKSVATCALGMAPPGDDPSCAALGALCAMAWFLRRRRRG